MNWLIHPNRPKQFKINQYQINNPKKDKLLREGKLYLFYTLIAFALSIFFTQIAMVGEVSVITYFFPIYGIATGLTAYFYFRRASKLEKRGKPDNEQ